MRAIPVIVSFAASTLLSLVAVAAPPDACRVEAERLANLPAQESLSSAQFLHSDAATREALVLAHPCNGTACKQAYYATSKAISGIAPPGFVPDDEYGTATAPLWAKLPANSACKELYVLRFKPLECTADSKVLHVNLMADATTLPAALSAYQNPSTMKTLGVGPAQGGLEDAAAETLQILGQIVVDRASAEAYRLLKDKLELLLGCNPDVDVSKAKVETPKGAPRFPATCKVLKPLRIQDLATSRDALFGALAADGISYITSSNASNSLDAEIGIDGVLASVIMPLLARPKLLADSAQAKAIVGALEAYVAKWTMSTPEKRGERALVAGVLAYARCVAASAESQGTNALPNCDFAKAANQFAGSDPKTQAAARALAGQLVSVASLNTPQGVPDSRQRILHAVDAVFASTCMLLDPADVPDFKCPDPPATLDVNKVQPRDALALLQPVIDGALEGDSNAVVASVAYALELFAKGEYDKTHKRAFLLLGALLQYSATYGDQTTANAQQMHDQRTKILESLTKDMTDRTARDGDDVWSFGGSLRVAGGIRIGGAAPAFLGPLSLPIGLGFDHVSVGRGASVHLEFSMFDLGQYVSYDNKGTVRTPNVTDSVSPSFTVGVGWGKSIPLFVGASVGYSPGFALTDTKDTQGTFNASAVLGMYVPLIDIN